MYSESIDNIIGILNHKDYFNYILEKRLPLDSAIKTTLYTTSTMKISKLLKLLQQAKSHIAIITDEYGGTLVIVTMEDIIE